MAQLLHVVITTSDGRRYAKDGTMDALLDMLVEPDYQVQSAKFYREHIPLKEVLRIAVEHGSWDVYDDHDRIDAVRRLIDKEEEADGEEQQ